MSFTRAAAPATTNAGTDTKNKRQKTAKPPRPEGRTNKPLAAVAVLLIAGCATAGALAYTTAGDRTPVLSLARNIPAGQVITREDLRVAEVNGSGFSAVASDHADRVIGTTAESNLPAGSLITLDMITQDVVPTAGNVVVSASLKPGAVPAGTEPGRYVGVLQLPAANSAQGASDSGAVAQGIVNSALVVDVSTDAASAGNTVISLQVPDGAAEDFATAAAAGALAVTLLPVGS